MAIQNRYEEIAPAEDAAPREDVGADVSRDGNLDLLVEKLKPISRTSGSWEWIIIEKCGGQSIRQVVRTIYFDELDKCAWLTDIGLWKSLFDRAVLETVYDLARAGYISLLPDPKPSGSNRAGRS